MAMTEVAGNSKLKRIEPAVVELPPDRKAAIAYGLEQFQRLAAEKDTRNGEIAKLKTDLAAQRVVAEALQSQLTEAESRVNAAYAVRDEAVARRAQLETVLSAILALGRSFMVEHIPLIKEVDHA